jgi:hypothetical protein
MLAGKAKPRGCEKRVSQPTGENEVSRGVGGKLAQKHDRLMLAGKAKPRECEERAGEPKG